MMKHLVPPDLPVEARALAERYPVLHKKFGVGVLLDLVATCNELSMETLNNVAERNPDIAAEVASEILGYLVERRVRG